MVLFIYVVQDVLKGIAEREKWDLQDLRVSKLDVKKSKFGTLRRYEFRVRIGKTEFVFMMADEVSQWKGLHFPNKNESDFESLVKEIGSKATLDVLKIQGPFELYATGDDYLSLTLPVCSPNPLILLLFVAVHFASYTRCFFCRWSLLPI